MSSFTKGPWLIDRFKTADGIVDCGIYAEPYTGHAYSICRAPRLIDKEIWKANARLIAASPELYKELSHLVKLLEPLEQKSGLAIPGLATLNGARAALSKVKG